MEEIRKRFSNLMYFFSVTDFRHRDAFVAFLRETQHILQTPPEDAFVTGVRFEGGLAQATVFAKERPTSRPQQSFLFFSGDDQRDNLLAKTRLGMQTEVERSVLVPSVRSTAGVSRMDISDECDYLATRPYRSLRRVERALGSSVSAAAWQYLRTQVERAKTHLCIVERINPFSPSTRFIAMFGDRAFVPTNSFHSVIGRSKDTAKALTILYNSLFFLAQWFLARDESGGRYEHLEIYELQHMPIFPPERLVPSLAKVFDQFARTEFPPLTQQLDTHFEYHYKAFWSGLRNRQPTMFSSLPSEPDPRRLELDLAVCQALGLALKKRDLKPVYDSLVREMVITRGLQRD